MDLIERLHSKGLIKPPPFVLGGTKYLTLMGSVSYAVSSDTSDMDIYGWCIPPKDIIFPHTAGYIPGFSTQVPNFDQFEKHHVIEEDHRKEYDINIYSVIKYFRLVMDNNPNMIDSLFTDQTCVLKSTKLSEHVRDNRKLFLHRGSWFRFKGYAYQQMHHLNTKRPKPGSKRYDLVQKYGYDTKFAYHIPRLLNEVEQILVEGDLDLRRNNEQLKAIRRGEWPLEELKKYVADKEKNLEKVYAESKLRDRPDEPAITKLLLEVLEEHFGSLEGAVDTKDQYKAMLRQIQQIVNKV